MVPQPNAYRPPPAAAVEAAALVCLVASLAAAAPGDPPAPASSFTVRADWFIRGNVRADSPPKGYADKYPCILNDGPVPNVAEYDIDFPVSAEYTFVALYTAMHSRPVDICLDDTKVHRGFTAVTGDWKSSRAKWEIQCKMQVSEGRHTIKLHCPGPCMPHICAFRLESPVPFPDGWRLCREIPRAPPSAAKPEDMSDYVCDYPRDPPAVYDYHQPYTWIPPPGATGAPPARVRPARRRRAQPRSRGPPGGTGLRRRNGGEQRAAEKTRRGYPRAHRVGGTPLAAVRREAHGD